MISLRSIVFLSVYLFGLAALNTADAYVEKSGNVSGESWPAGTYLVTGNLTVSSGAALDMAAGAVVKFQPGVLFTVYGTLRVNGMDGNNVILTSRDDDTYGETIPGSDSVLSAELTWKVHHTPLT